MRTYVHDTRSRQLSRKEILPAVHCSVVYKDTWPAERSSLSALFAAAARHRVGRLHRLLLPGVPARREGEEGEGEGHLREGQGDPQEIR